MNSDTTHLAPTLHQAQPGSTVPSALLPPSSLPRTTVLPRVVDDGTGAVLSSESRSRYEATTLLGVGGMGEVVLVRDQDIERKVAVKRIAPNMTNPAVLARFVDEIRIV